MGHVNDRPGLPLLSDYTRFLRRHRAPLAALMVLGLLCGSVWSTRHPAAYSSTASVALAAVPKYVTDTNTQLLAPTVSIDTEAQLLRSHRVMGAIGAALGTDETEAASHLTVTAAPLTRVLKVTITASTPQAAADAANAAVSTLVNVIRDTLGALQDSQLNQVRTLLQTRETEFAKEQARRVVIPDTDDLFNEVLQLQASVDELEEARHSPATIMHAADPPQRADYSNREVPMVSGLMLGFLLACLAGVARDRSALPAISTAVQSINHLRRRTVAGDPS